MTRSGTTIAGLAAVSLIALAVAWAERASIARSFIDDALTSKGVAARYQITQIGLSTQRLETISIGDPMHPDLEADWIEVDTSNYLAGGAVNAVRAGGVRLHGSMREGQLSLGAIDKLLPPPSNTPFKLPDLPITINRAQMRLDSDWGAIGIGAAGKGNLASAFRGHLAVAAPRLAQGDCRATALLIESDVTVDHRRPAFKGPAKAAEIACAGVTARTAQFALDAGLSEDLSRWFGNAGGEVAAVSGQGFVGKAAKIDSDFAGNSVRTGGKVNLALASLAGAQFTGGATALSGNFDVGRSPSGFYLKSDGRMTMANARPNQTDLATLTSFGNAGSGTPAAPIARQLAQALGGLARGSAVSARYAMNQSDGEGVISLSDIQGVSASGIRMAVQGAPPVSYGWPSGLSLKGQIALAGGGLPATQVLFDGFGGVARVAPYAAGTARLALSPIAFQLGSRFSIQTMAVIDGPLGAGQVTGLRGPVVINRGKAALDGCQSLAFERLTLSALSLNPATLKVCIRGGEAQIANPLLTGRLSGTPIALRGSSARVKTGNGDFSVADLAILLGANGKTSRLNADQFSGSLQSGGASGRYAGMSGQLANVPLKVSQGAGLWSLQGGAFSTNGQLRVDDDAKTPRFSQLAVDDMVLKLVNNRISAMGTARNPKSGVAVTTITIAHDLGSGRGNADLNVAALTFGQALQPEELTPITLGVIANVKGTVSGAGRINWSPEGVTSSGSFGTDKSDLAAAFGPLTGLTGRIALSDLLGLTTSDPQTVKIGSINPGIAVQGGEITYRLLPGLRAEILGGSWPFAGGVLSLQPTILDLNSAAERRLTFKVNGLDAARFVTTMEYQDIAATGVFDGELPMIFDQDGGRIEGGHLVARSGGTLAYLGQISEQNLGTMGKIAFDALRSIKYSRLAIDLDGNIGGDVVTRISFAGVNQAPINGIRPKLPFPVKVRGLTNFPFIFNVKITAKFRQLFDTVRSINDPSILVEDYLSGVELTPVNPNQPVQPPERTPVP